jgi:hypothetical protein
VRHCYIMPFYVYACMCVPCVTDLVPLQIQARRSSAALYARGPALQLRLLLLWA